MATRAIPSKHLEDLRRQAEKKISGVKEMADEKSSVEIRNLIHELQVHKVELEMQIEAFQSLQTENTAAHLKYIDLYDFAPVGYFTLDKKGRIIEGNVTGAGLFGFEKRFLAGQPFHRFILPADFAPFQSCLREAFETKSKQTCRLRLVKRDGTPFDALLETIAVTDDEGRFDHYRSSVTDITEITLAEALRDSEEKYHGLYESTQDGIVRTDMEGCLVECNPAFIHMTGYTGEEIRKLTHQQITPAKWRAMEEAVLTNKILKTGYSDAYEKEYIRKDGSVFPVSIKVWAIKDERSQPAGLWAIARDITEQKLAEVRYKAIINTAIDGFWIADNAGHFREVNDAYCSLTGYSREELLQMTISDVEAGETPPETARHMRHLMKKGHDRFETRHRCKDGRIVDIEVSANSTEMDGGIVFAHLRNISRRKMREREIKRNEERLESLLKISQYEAGSVKDLLEFALNEAIGLTESKVGYIYLYDDKTQEFQLNSRSREVMAEVRVAEKNTVYQFENTGIWEEAVRQGKPVMVNDFQASHPLKKGYPEGHAVLYRYLTLPVFSDDHIVAVVGVANKMTDYDEPDVWQLTLLMNSAWKIVEWTRAEDALRDSEIRYRRLFEAAQDGILIIDMDTGRITDVNPYLMNFLGYGRNEFLGKHLWEIGAFKNTALSRAAFLELKSKGYIRYDDLPLEAKDGRSIHLEFISNVYEVDQATVIQCNIRDVTKRKWAERELQERTLQLEAANKELESFSYSVSHDLRAPLRAIDGYSRMILNKQGDRFDEETRSRFDVIRSNTRVMGQLIDDLLAFSRMGKQEMALRKLEMDDLFKGAWAELKLANADRKMTLTIGRMPPALGDRGLMKQVVINLLSNAVKFTKNQDDARIKAGAFAGDDEIVFYVKDNGAGFDMQYSEKLFGVFQRLHRVEEFEGTGVGLAIVQRIIHRHGGRVWAESDIGRGACFYFTLKPGG